MATFSNTSKNTATFTATAKHASSASNTAKSMGGANAGQPVGLLLALTYSGGQSINMQWASTTKH